MPAAPTLDRTTASRRSATPERSNPPDALPSAERTRPEGPYAQNRIPVLLMHIPRLSIQGQARPAGRAGVSRSTISRLLRGRISPSYRLVRAVTDALGRDMEG